MNALLVMQNISKSFEATRALVNVSLDAMPGQALALVGENGAGKSTLMKILSGAHQADSGTIQLGGVPFAPKHPVAARRAGVAMIYQELNLAQDLSVEDNIMLGIERSRLGFVRRSEQRSKVQHALSVLGHGDLDPRRRTASLSIGAQQVVEIARALVSDARVVIFDEPTSSLSRHDVEHLFQIIATLKEQGMAIIYISHFLEEVRRVAERFTVLRDGETIGSGHLVDRSDDELVSMMIGRSVDNLFPHVPHAVGPTVMRCKNLAGARSPQDVTFDLRQGEIFGLFGLIGAGRTETLRCLLGLDKTVHGQVQVRDRSLPASITRRMANGLGLVSEDRKREGLAQQMSIADNMTLSHLRPYSIGGLLTLGKRRRQVESWMERLRVKARSADQTIGQLSGGNQQKVAIARVLHQNASIVLLDEPTRGIDVGTKAEIYRLMGELAGAGKSILFVSSYLPELLAVCDRVGVMSRGRLRAIRDASQWTENEVLSVAIATDTETEEAIA